MEILFSVYHTLEYKELVGSIDIDVSIDNFPSTYLQIVKNWSNFI